MNLLMISNRLGHYHMYEVDDIACIYSMTNIESEKMYIGNTKTLRARLALHIHEFKAGTHYNREMQSDFDKGTGFRVDVLAVLDKEDDRKERNALEAYFVILYNSLENGYNMVYTYQDKQYAIRAIQQNIAYITRCLRKNGLNQSAMIFEDVVEINP